MSEVLRTASYDYTKEQLEVLHKAVHFNYNPKDETNLVTAEEYAILDAFLKGYVWHLQANHPKSLIPKNYIKSVQFADGVQQARDEVKSNIIRNPARA